MTLFWQAPPEGQVSFTPKKVDSVLYKATADGQVPYTQEEMEIWEADRAKAIAECTEQAITQYQRDRAAKYPPIGDQLDALWKGGDAATAMLAQVQAVKAKYPKSE
jgi:hypothetical protein